MVYINLELNIVTNPVEKSCSAVDLRALSSTVWLQTLLLILPW